MTRLLTSLLAACAQAYPAGGRAKIRHDAVISGVRLGYWTARPVATTDVPVLYLHGGPGYNSYSFRRTAGTKLAARHPMGYLAQRVSGGQRATMGGRLRHAHPRQ
jgi:proline iminopeptidase